MTLTTERLEEMRPCPFCGSTGSAVEPHTYPSGDVVYGIICDECGCQTPGHYTTPQYAIAAWNRRSLDKGEVVKSLDIADTCDGVEQDAFEVWASSEKYDMHEHPMHYLFLDPKTDAARMGWKAGIIHARDRIRSALVSQPAPKGVDDNHWRPIETVPNGEVRHRRTI